jgi:hypothetical protein
MAIAVRIIAYNFSNPSLSQIVCIAFVAAAQGFYTLAHRCALSAMFWKPGAARCSAARWQIANTRLKFTGR